MTTPTPTIQPAEGSDTALDKEAEDRLTNLFLAGFETNDPPLLDWIRTKFRIRSAERRCAELEAVLTTVHKELECPARNTTATSYRRDGSVIISCETRSLVARALAKPNAAPGRKGGGE